MRGPLGKSALLAALVVPLGPARAGRLLDAFGSVEAVLSASADELTVVDGVGPTTASAIRWIVSEQPACYESVTVVR